MVVLTALMFAIVVLQQPETMSLLEKPLYAPALSKEERAAREAALAAARAAYAKDRTGVDAILGLARAQMALGLVGESLETLTHGVESKPDEPRLSLERGRGLIVIRKFDTPRDLMSLPEPVVVNCTGLGSFTLFDDKELVPIKGQLTALPAQPEVTYRAGGRTASGGNASMNARSDGIIVGNLQDRGNWSLEPDQDVLQRNVQAAIDFFAMMRPPTPGAPLTRSVPPQTAPTLDTFFDAQS